MTDKPRSIRGMRDLFGQNFHAHEYIVKTSKELSEIYGYEGFATPLLEYTKVFDRTLGDSSDVVSKEMYDFLDKSGNSVALRPEFTAGIVRAIISNNLQQNIPLKLFSHGPVFRYDRPQAGRQRQFHQINCEYIGANTPYSDAELIKLAQHILTEIGIINDITLEINSLGCQESRTAYQGALVNYFNKYKNELSEDSQKRLLKNNALRILDSKILKDQEIASTAPIITDYYTKRSKTYFDQTLEKLDILNINYKINTRLARGLDYYCHTAFEFTTKKLGAQATVLAGGRYDYLFKLMGGADIPAIGFAGGIERLAMMINHKIKSKAMICVIPIGEECINYTVKFTDYLRQNNLPTLLMLKGKIQKRIENALKSGAHYIVFAGEDEMKNNKFKLKILTSKEEKTMSKEEISNFIKL